MSCGLGASAERTLPGIRAGCFYRIASNRFNLASLLSKQLDVFRFDSLGIHGIQVSANSVKCQESQIVSVWQRYGLSLV